jgi:3-hydroxyacyl-CoA dehydrogenase
LTCPAREGPKNGIVTKAIEGLKKLKPSPLGVVEDASLIRQANYEEHMEQLKDCDLIIEAIAERMDWKLDLYKKIAPFIAPHAIVASNTSGLSITKLSEALPEEIKPRFCGIHFFNPPRYMYLVELIATPTTAARDPGRPGNLCDQRPGQGRGARQRHAQLHRQPRGHCRHAGHDERGGELRPDL